jgi:putative ABC transport system substrate-binding protein
MIASGHPLFINRRVYVQLSVLAARHRLPTIYSFREVVEAGGLVSYGPLLADAWQQAGTYVALILNGSKPADLPVVQPTRFRLVLNPATARALGLTIPETLLATADELIE